MAAVSNIQWNWSLIAPGSGILLIAVLCYLAGRMQQYHQQGMEREKAWAQGYNAATVSLFSLATRTSKAIEAPALVEAQAPKKMVRGVVRVGRHSVDTGDISTMQRTKPVTAWEQYHPAA